MTTIYQIFRLFQMVNAIKFISLSLSVHSVKSVVPIFLSRFAAPQKSRMTPVLSRKIRVIRGSSILEFGQTSIFGMKLLLPLLLASCAGYHLGNPKPVALARIKSIAVPMFNNDTQHPKAEVLATSAVASALTQDGTFHLTSCEHADAILSGHLKNISYSSIRGSRLDTVHPEELTNTVTLAWTLTDAKNPRLILATGSSLGTSQLFVDPDLQTARNNALPDALERAAEALVSRLANGF